MVQSPNQSGMARGRQMDFVAKKSPVSPAPTPVTSAQAAINAMYAARADEQPAQPQPTPQALAVSARAQVNAAAAAGKQSVPVSKSAANLHHGSIPKNIETVRPSASALLKVAKAPQPSLSQMKPTNSFDPLARTTQKPITITPKVVSTEAPVIRTSLKLGAAARPKPKPMVLPPNARMARQARPVAQSKLAQLLSHQPTEAQIMYPNTINPGHPVGKLQSGVKELPPAEEAVTVKITKPTAPAKATAQPSAQPPVTAAKPRRRRPDFAPRSAKPARFRSAPKNYAVAEPEVISPDSSYVMTTPPKIKLAAAHADKPELGVVENYHAPKTPEPIGDKAPIGRVKVQEVASGHGRSAEPPTIKADNASNYSFSRKTKPADNNRYTLGGESPFIKSVSVEKRPLSDKVSPRRPKLERPTDNTKPAKASRKNIYTKKAKTDQRDLPSRPTVIIPSSRRSKAPLFFLVLFTIILGAVVGAAAYLCFFQ